jgi:hypothetical protein
MIPHTCPRCGRQTTDEPGGCPDCDAEPKKGANGRMGDPTSKPPIPAEVAGWVIEQVPPDVLEWARQTCNEEEFTEALREIEHNGGVELKDFIHELEEGAAAGD